MSPQVTRAVPQRPEMNHIGQGSREHSSRYARRLPLPSALRIAIYAVGALLWLTGAVWLVLHHALPQATPFGPLPNPWEAPLMRTHGLIAVCGVFLIGWMMAAHVTTRWTSDRNRRSGLTLGVIALLLVISGYALYYTTDALHDAAALVHEVIGTLSPAAAFAHWWRRRART
jgi:hypothetical protein